MHAEIRKNRMFGKMLNIFEMPSRKKLSRKIRKTMGTNPELSGFWKFPNFAKIGFRMQAEIVKMCHCSEHRFQITILASDSDSAHQIMQIRMLKMKTWCEALSAVGPKCKSMRTKISGSNFDLNHPVLIPFQCPLELCFQTPEANTERASES